VLDTADGKEPGRRYEAGSQYPLEPRSLVILTRRALVERLREAAAPPAEERPSLEDVPEAAPPAATSESLRRERELAEVGEGS
jgi:hypothetical protein